MKKLSFGMPLLKGLPLVLLCVALALTITRSAHADEKSKAVLGGLVIGVDPCNQMTTDTKTEPVYQASGEMAWRASCGAVGVKTKIPEYDTNLAAAEKLADLLRESGAEVAMSRGENDIELSNAERASLMNAAKVDLWVRISCNYSADASERGVVISFPSRVYAPHLYGTSLSLARHVTDAVEKVSGVKSARILALANQAAFNTSQRPVINVGIGFLSNPHDDVLINRESQQTRIIRAVFNGIVNYLSELNAEG